MFIVSPVRDAISCNREKHAETGWTFCREPSYHQHEGFLLSSSETFSLEWTWQHLGTLTRGDVILHTQYCCWKHYTHDVIWRWCLGCDINVTWWSYCRRCFCISDWRHGAPKQCSTCFSLDPCTHVQKYYLINVAKPKYLHIVHHKIVCSFCHVNIWYTFLHFMKKRK